MNFKGLLYISMLFNFQGPFFPLLPEQEFHYITQCFLCQRFSKTFFAFFCFLLLGFLPEHFRLKWLYCFVCPFPFRLLRAVLVRQLLYIITSSLSCQYLFCNYFMFFVIWNNMDVWICIISPGSYIF